MMPVPIPDGVAEAMGGQRVVLGDPGDPTGPVRPCEYVLTASELYPGGFAVHAIVVPDDEDLRRLAAGAPLLLTLDGGEVPWCLSVGDPP